MTIARRPDHGNSRGDSPSIPSGNRGTLYPLVITVRRFKSGQALMILERQNIMPQIDSTRTGNIKSYRYSSRRETEVENNISSGNSNIQGTVQWNACTSEAECKHCRKQNRRMRAFSRGSRLHLTPSSPAGEGVETTEPCSTKHFVVRVRKC